MTPEQKKEFMGKWIKMGYGLLKRAERLGLDPIQIGVYHLQTHVKFVEDLGEPMEVRPAR